MDENFDNRSLAQPFLAYQLSSISGFAAGPLIIMYNPEIYILVILKTNSRKRLSSNRLFFANMILLLDYSYVQVCRWW